MRVAHKRPLPVQQVILTKACKSQKLIKKTKILKVDLMPSSKVDHKKPRILPETLFLTIMHWNIRKAGRFGGLILKFTWNPPLGFMRGKAHLSWGRPPRWTWTAAWGSPRRRTPTVSSAVAAEQTSAGSCPAAAPRPVRLEVAAVRLHWRWWRGGSGGEESALSWWIPAIHNFIKRAEGLENRLPRRAASCRSAKVCKATANVLFRKLPPRLLDAYLAQ